MLSQFEHIRLLRILELTRSGIDGEALAAVRAAHRILAGRCYADAWPAPQTEADSPQPEWKRAGAFCKRWPDALTVWERNFVADLLTRRATLTLRQAEIFWPIAQKAEAFAAEVAGAAT